MSGLDALALRLPGIMAAAQQGRNSAEAERYRRAQLEREQQRRDAEAQQQAVLNALLIKSRENDVSRLPNKNQQEDWKFGRQQTEAGWADEDRTHEVNVARPVTDAMARLTQQRMEKTNNFMRSPEEQADLQARTYNKTVGSLPRNLFAAGAGGSGNGLDFQEVARLRTEWRNSSPFKSYQLATVANEQMKQLAQDDTGASDVNLLIAAAKVADPESVVREGEVAIQRIAASLADRIGVTLANLQSGKMLTPQQRANILQAAASRYGPMQEMYRQQRAYYERLAHQFGADPFQVVGEDAPLGGAGPAKSPPDSFEGATSDTISAADYYDSLIRAGKSPAEAYRATELKFGPPED